MTEEHGWARPGSGDLPPGWSSEQPPPYQPGPGAPGPGGPGSPYGRGPGGPGGPYGPGPGGPYGPGPGGMPPGMRPPAPKPGIVPLRPLGLGELLDGAFTGIRRNPKATLGLSAILMTIAAVVEGIVSFLFLDSATTLSMTPSAQINESDVVRLISETSATLALSLIVSLVATTILTGLLTIVYGRAVLGRFLTMGEAWAAVRPRLWRLLGVTLLILVIMMAVVVVGFAAPVVLAIASPGWATVLLAVVLAIATVCALVYLHIKLALAESAVVLEDAGVGASLRRSFRLTSRSFWRVLGILLLTNLIAGVINGVIQTPFALGQLPIALGADPSTGLHLISVVLTTIGTIVATTVTTPFVAGVGVLLYVDLRMRREGLDLQLQTAATNPDQADFASLWQPAHGATAPYDPGGGAPGPGGGTPYGPDGDPPGPGGDAPGPPSPGGP